MTRKKGIGLALAGFAATYSPKAYTRINSGATLLRSALRSLIKPALGDSLQIGIDVQLQCDAALDGVGQALLNLEYYC